MDNTIIKRKSDGILARITHWHHFYVNRATGFIIDEAFTYKVINGEEEGKTFVSAIDSMPDLFDVVGRMKTSKVIQ